MEQLSFNDMLNIFALRKAVEGAQRRCCASRSCTSNSETEQLNLKHCARCDAASYCSKDCQVAHWKSHKKLCKLLEAYKSCISELDMPMQRAALARMTLDAPPVHEEYRRRYPSMDQLPITATIAEARSLVLVRTRDNLKDLFGSENDLDQLFWRYQEVSPELRKFLRAARPGDIFRKKKYLPYAPRGPQQFRNTPLLLKGVLKNGITMIDIGFVDLGIVIDSIESLDVNGEPIRIIGIEAEPFCVAKALVLCEMAKKPENKARSVVEVWFSSLWSYETSQAFSAAVENVLQSTVLEKTVKNVLEFWLTHPRLSRVTSLAFQMEAAISQRDIRFCTNACNLKSERDRVDYLRYFFTKAFYEDESTTVGSPVMSAENQALGLKQILENAFEAIPVDVYTWSNPHYSSHFSIMDRVHAYFESKMMRYMLLVQKGVIQFEPRVGVISPDNTELLHDLAGHDPYVVCWSNVVDYIEPRIFHSMARQISGNDTMHYLHSINWPTRTYGVDIYEVPKEMRLQIFSIGLSFREQTRLALGGFESLGSFHFRNICSAVLARKYLNSFLRYFFEGQENIRCTGFFAENSPLRTVDNPLGRSPTTAFLVFAYQESGITFPSGGWDFTKD